MMICQNLSLNQKCLSNARIFRRFCKAHQNRGIRSCKNNQLYRLVPSLLRKNTLHNRCRKVRILVSCFKKVSLVARDFCKCVNCYGTGICKNRRVLRIGYSRKENTRGIRIYKRKDVCRWSDNRVG